MSYDGFFISGFPVLEGVSMWVSLLTSRALQLLSRGWARVPRQGYPSGGRGGQRGCREALPPRRPREPGEGGWRPLPPQPRSWNWKLRRRWVIRWSTLSSLMVQPAIPRTESTWRATNRSANPIQSRTIFCHMLWNSVLQACLQAYS